MTKVLLSFAMTLALSNVLPATTITAEWVPVGFNSSSSVATFSNGAFVPGQTFTALVTGLIDSIGVGISTPASNNPSANNVLVTLWSTSGGLPFQSIATGTIVSPQNGFADGQLHFADMTISQTPPTLTAGTLYAFTLGAANASPSINWAGTFTPNVYADGNFLSSNNGGATWSTGSSSGVFRINVSPTTAVPEPSTCLLLTAGLLTILRLRRAA